MSRARVAGLKPALVLMVICMVFSAILVVVHDLTKGKIAEVEREKVNRALSEVFPSAEFEKIDDYYKVFENGVLVGYALLGEGQGYGGVYGGEPIKLVVGVNLDKTVKSVKIISHSETPGIGSKIEEENFLSQFSGKTLEDLKLRSDGGKIDAITGATISSKAVVDIVRGEVQKIASEMGEGR